MKGALLAAAVIAGCATVAFAANVEINPPAEGSVTKEEGLEAWSRIYQVASHPRCANCHVGESSLPMWSGPSYGKTRPHGMRINAGESRIGAEYIPCQACHTPLSSPREGANAVPHSAPRVAGFWMLAPVEAHWFGMSTEDICSQLRDPERNGGRSTFEIAQHLDHDTILHWAWNPGGNREPAPYDLQSHVNDVLAWGAAGTPCPQD